jgi:hypothetical protein
MEVEAWFPCRVEADMRKQRPRNAYITLADTTGRLKKGDMLLLKFRLKDDMTAAAVGEVAKVFKDGTAKIVVPHFVAVSVAVWCGVDISGAGGKVLVYNCAVKYTPIEDKKQG